MTLALVVVASAWLGAMLALYVRDWQDQRRALCALRAWERRRAWERAYRQETDRLAVEHLLESL